MRTNDFIASRGALQLLQVLGGPLAIVPAARQQLLDIIERHARDDPRDLMAIRAKLGNGLGQTPRDGYEVSSGVAILPVQGTIFPKSNVLIEVSGGASAQLIARDVTAAAADPGVKAILLSIDSPGGSVAGVPEAAQAVREAARTKPVVAYSDGMLASAAYWLGSAANSVWVSGAGVMVGSIGVVATHTDRSRADATAGITKTEIVAGKYKAAGSGNRPLDADGAATIQAQVDYVYGLLVNAVAAHRGVSVETVLAKMADGRIFIGQQAIDAGLVDGIASIDALVADLAANPARYAARGRAPASPAATSRAVPARFIAATAASSSAATPTSASKAPAMQEPVLTTAELTVRAAAVASRQRSEAVAAATKSILTVYFQATGTRPDADADTRPRVARSATAAPAAASVHPPAQACAGSRLASDPKAAAAPTSAQRAAAESVVALFNRVNRSQEAS